MVYLQIHNMTRDQLASTTHAYIRYQDHCHSDEPEQWGDDQEDEHGYQNNRYIPNGCTRVEVEYNENSSYDRCTADTENGGDEGANDLPFGDGTVASSHEYGCC